MGPALPLGSLWYSQILKELADLTMGTIGAALPEDSTCSMTPCKTTAEALVPLDCTGHKARYGSCKNMMLF